MIVRRAIPDDLTHLKQPVDLARCVCMVAEEDGEIVGMLPSRLIWEAEPGLVWSGNKIADSRALLMMYKATETHIRSTPVRELYVHTYRRKVIGWAERLGWHRLYRRASHFYKQL